MRGLGARVRVHSAGARTICARVAGEGLRSRRRTFCEAFQGGLRGGREAGALPAAALCSCRRVPPTPPRPRHLLRSNSRAWSPLGADTRLPIPWYPYNPDPEPLNGILMLVRPVSKQPTALCCAVLPCAAAIYEIGAHGDVVVMAAHKSVGPTDRVQFTLDQGSCWMDVKLPEAIAVDNIR